jgi:hypothetical protein
VLVAVFAFGTPSGCAAAAPPVPPGGRAGGIGAGGRAVAGTTFVIVDDHEELADGARHGTRTVRLSAGAWRVDGEGWVTKARAPRCSSASAPPRNANDRPET